LAASVITPVTVLTGFLGSGKTTLLNRILADPRYADTAVIVNEFGEVAIDHLLVREASENVVVLAGGCICCRVAGDLVRTLRELHRERSAGSIPAFRRAVIETTGLADPAPLLASMIELPMIAARYSLSGVAATVDAEHGMRTLDEHEEAVKQVALADRLVITKDDLAAAARVAQLEERLRELNPGAPVLRSGLAPIDPAQILDAGLYRPQTRSVDARGWLDAGAYRPAGMSRPSRHDPRIVAFSWRAEEPLAWPDLEEALGTLLDLFGDRILRLKGLANVGEPGPLALHAVQHALYPPARLAAWPDEDHGTRLVFVTRDLEAARITPILDSLSRTPSEFLQR
jgi:G3E family GTPase